MCLSLVRLILNKKHLCCWQNTNEFDIGLWNQEMFDTTQYLSKTKSKWKYLEIKDIDEMKFDEIIYTGIHEP